VKGRVLLKKTAVIIGAGPAGLTAAYELLDRTDVLPVVFEAAGDLGGISKTVNYKGNRIDIGGHRFFSKSDRVMAWWQNILPLQGAPSRDDLILQRDVPLAQGALRRPLGESEARPEPPPDPETTDAVMLVRRRISRIYFLRKFFSYPVTLSLETLRNLGLRRVFKVGLSYLRARLRPIRPEKSLEDFFINRFGRELYATFFRDYTEKVWGVPCAQIRPEWGAQRVKGLSVTRALLHAARRLVRRDASVAQKGTETSLIELFAYPKLGPGQMWETVAQIVRDHGGEIHLNQEVVGFECEGDRLRAVKVRDAKTGEVTRREGDYFFSTMPVKDLVAALDAPVPERVRAAASGLLYRDFVTVGVLLKGLKISNRSGIPTVNGIVPDNWIYIQESEVRMGRLQVFNNWSPYLVADPSTVWVGVEYFCQEGDNFWNQPDEAIARLAVRELQAIGFAEPSQVLDSVTIRMPKAYPAYFGTYDRFEEVRRYLDGFTNLFPIGRNGQHRYNNQDHSMLTAMTAVDCILSGTVSKEVLWAVNTEREYHEEK
jgi:protoporphyrinogen oxidase